MATARRSVLAGWIGLVLVGGSAGVVARAPHPVPRVQVTAVAPITDAPTTTTVAPTTTTTAPPPPPPPTTVPPPPTTTTTARPRTTTTRATTPAVAATTAVAPASVVKAPAPAATPTYAMELLQQVIPARWLAAVPARVEVIAGQTSWSSWGGLIEIGDRQLLSSIGHARNTLAHEWGHQVAWLYGTDAYDGAPPEGFPYAGAKPEEQWADCVALSLTGMSYPSVGLGRCPADALAFTSQFLGAGPGTPLRTS